MSKNKRILYLSYDGMTDPLGQSQVLPYLVGLAKAAYDITIISFEKHEKAADAQTIEAFCKKHNLEWHPLPYTRRPPVISTLRDIRAMRKKASRLQQLNAFDIVHCRSYVPALIGQWMQKRFGVKFLFDMRGFWADERVDGGLWRLSNPLFKKVYSFFKKKEKQFLICADQVVSLTYSGKEEIERWNLNDAAPIAVIPCCADTLLFDPETISSVQVLELRKSLGVGVNQTVLGYVGSVGTWYLLPEMLEFFKIFLLKNPEAVFLFVTAEPAKMIEENALKLGINPLNIRIVKALRNEVPAYIRSMDLGIFFIKPAFSKKASSPVKQGEMMAMGLPVVCNSGLGDSDFIVKKYKSGLLVEGFSVVAYEAALSQLSTIDFDSKKIREGAKEYFDLQKGINAYRNIYEQLLSHS